MRLPLLAAARPKSCKAGPTVPLPSGRWHIIHDLSKDTILEMLVDGVPSPTPLVAEVNGHEIDGPCTLQLRFLHRGSELYVNVSAELQRAS